MKNETEVVPEVITHAPVVFPEPNLTKHNWKQRGTNVHCDSCRYPHGFSVPADQLLTGVDENGYPVFKSLSI